MSTAEHLMQTAPPNLTFFMANLLKLMVKCENPTRYVVTIGRKKCKQKNDSRTKKSLYCTLPELAGSFTRLP